MFEVDSMFGNKSKRKLPTLTRRIFGQIVWFLVEAVGSALRAKLLNSTTVLMAGDGKGKREVLDFLAIDVCTLEATHGNFGIREVIGIDIDGPYDSDNDDSDPLQAINAVKNSERLVNSSLTCVENFCIRGKVKT